MSNWCPFCETSFLTSRKKHNCPAAHLRRRYRRQRRAEKRWLDEDPDMIQQPPTSYDDRLQDGFDTLTSDQ